MLKYKRSIVSLTPCCLSFFLMLNITLLNSAAETGINEKVSQLDMSNSTLDDVIRIFGEPEKYVWGGETFTKDNLPSTFIASYDSGKFKILMKTGKVNEIRFEQGEIGYVYKGKIRIGSTLNDVIEVTGQAKETIVGKPLPRIAEDGVLYKDINGRNGYCYYKPAGQNVRFFFGDERVSAIYLTAGQKREKPVMDINAKIAQLDINDSTIDDVIRIFGEPEKYVWSGKTFTKDNLPSKYLASYYSDKFQIVMSIGTISEIRFRQRGVGYVYKGKIRIGSTLNDVIEVTGQAKETIVGRPLPRIAEDGVLYKDINGRKGYCYYRPAGQDVRFFFGDYKVSALYLTAPKSGGGDSFKTVKPITSVKRFDDVRWKDMSKLDLSGRKGLIATLRFNEETVWPIPGHLPRELNPKIVLARAMNPGLGVRRLHRQGITGKGTNVAIIDQAMYLDHPEFSGKIAAYHDLAAGERSSMHGPSVTSLLAGTKCGTAPDARVYYAAVRGGVYEVDYVDSIDWIIEKNRNLSTAEKIRVVSVSAAPGKAGTPSTDNQKKWDQACARAEAEGILVLDCTSHRGIISVCWYDANDPEDVSKCTPGFPGIPWQGFSSERIFVPASPRTTAEEYDKGKFGYQYCGRGGLSWAIPYCAGVLAMGWQINPELSSEQMRDLLFQSAYVKQSGEKIINPVEFIKLVRKTKAAQKQM